MSAPSNLFDKHLTTLVNCVQNVVYIYAFLLILETGMLFPLSAAKVVSPVDSWKGLLYNMWYDMLVFSMMKAFKDTLEALLLAEVAKRHRDDRKEATTYVAVDKDGASIKHVDNGMSISGFKTVAAYMITNYLAHSKPKEEQASAQNENDAKEASTPASTENDAKEASSEDEIKQDAASATSSTRSSADTVA